MQRACLMCDLRAAKSNGFALCVWRLVSRLICSPAERDVMLWSQGIVCRFQPEFLETVNGWPNPGHECIEIPCFPVEAGSDGSLLRN